MCALYINTAGSSADTFEEVKKSRETRLRMKTRPELKQHSSVEVKLVELEEYGRRGAAYTG